MAPEDVTRNLDRVDKTGLRGGQYAPIHHRMEDDRADGGENMEWREWVVGKDGLDVEMLLAAPELCANILTEWWRAVSRTRISPRD